jgi:hypothetical protein
MGAEMLADAATATFDGEIVCVVAKGQPDLMIFYQGTILSAHAAR